MNETKVLIIAAGEASRWGNHTGTTKHLVSVFNTPLLHRTVKQLNDRGYRPTIIAKDGVKGYEIEGADTEYITPNYEENADSDKFLSSKHLWNKKGRTIVLYGDVVFTRKAMDTITDFKGENWTLFCRPRRSLITGTPYGECFAQSFFPHDQKRHEENLHKAAELWRNGEIKRCGGWEHYRLMEGIDPRVHRKRMGKNHIVIDDATEDFDTPKDYDLWVERIKSSDTIDL